jgi:hypothetical protein
MNWQRLEELREIFLSASESNGVRDYWQDPELLDLYDRAFAQRIGWKWNAVWQDLHVRGWAGLEGSESITDWGCGTGIAVRSLLDFQKSHSTRSIRRIVLVDRSAMAMQFARARILENFPDIEIVTGTQPGQDPSPLFLSSHVGNELNAEAKSFLVRMIKTSENVVMVEPGTKDSSRFLGEMRSILGKQFHIAAPCLRQGDCPLTGQKSKDWCHQFANVPSEVHHSAFWSEFARRLKIDINSLPLSYLALSKKDKMNHPRISMALIGSERRLKHRSEILACGSAGPLVSVDVAKIELAEGSNWSANEHA